MQPKSLIGIFGLLCLLAIISFFGFTLSSYSPYISSPEKLLNYKDQGIMLLDRNDEPFYFANSARKDSYVSLNDISDNFTKAVITAEDKEFYKHYGISVGGIARSMLLNIKSKSLSFGGSTITQQLVKNTLLTPERSILRKAQEALLSLNVEFLYTKNEILEMYLNTIYYGDGTIGIKEASHHYFNKEPSELTLAESAYIAGMIKHPSMLSPFSGDRKLGKVIQENLLEKMASSEQITDSEKNLAISEELAFEKGESPIVHEAPHFALAVEQKLKEMFGEDVIREGYIVRTSLDLSLQEKAQQILKTQVNANRANGVSNGSIVVVDPKSGEILIMIGSKDWFDEKNGRINMAMTPRQPGSSFKPIVYALAFEEGLITPATVLNDNPKTYILEANCKPLDKECRYSPKDFDGRNRGKVTVRRALANSLNIPAVEVMNMVGIDTVVNAAPEFGITTLKDASYYGKGLSIVLGSAEVSPLEMALAYTPFANGGKRPEPTFILNVVDKYGETVYEYEPNVQTVVSEQTAYLITSILTDTRTRTEAFGSLLSTPFPAAVKTGTTENFRDAWTIGYTPNFVTAVWVGNNDGSFIRNLSGSLVAAPIWKSVMAGLVEGTTYSFKRPDGIVEASFCDNTSSGSARLDIFIEGTQPSRNCVKPKRRNAEIVSIEQNEIETISENLPAVTPTPQIN